jgi:hypothetical protein
MTATSLFMRVPGRGAVALDQAKGILLKYGSVTEVFAWINLRQRTLRAANRPR